MNELIDQAASLRKLMRATDLSGPHVGGRVAPMSVGPAPARTPRARVRFARAIAVMSGKGGVGKTNIAVNLAIALAQSTPVQRPSGGPPEPRRVCLLDADLGLANADVLCGISPRATLEEVLHGGRPLEEVMIAAPGGFRLLPGASGVASIANLGAEGRRRLLSQLAALERNTDALIVDTAAGIASNTMAFAAAAHMVLVAVTPEPTAITDAYGAIKTLVAKAKAPSIHLVVNMVNDHNEGAEVFRRIDRVSRTFLGVSLRLAGIVPFDSAVRSSVRKREPVLLCEPRSPASLAIRAIARGLIDDAASVIDPSAFANARAGFLHRLGDWMKSGLARHS